MQERICINAYSEHQTRRHLISFAIFDLRAMYYEKYYVGVFSHVGNQDERGPVCGYLVVREVHNPEEKKSLKSEIISAEKANELNKSGKLKDFLKLLKHLNNPALE